MGACAVPSVDVFGVVIDPYLTEPKSQSKVLVGGGAQFVPGSPLSPMQAVVQLEGASEQSKHDASVNT